MLILNSNKALLGEKADNGLINLEFKVSFHFSTLSQENKNTVGGLRDMGVKS